MVAPSGVVLSSGGGGSVVSSGRAQALAATVEAMMTVRV